MRSVYVLSLKTVSNHKVKYINKGQEKGNISQDQSNNSISTIDREHDNSLFLSRKTANKNQTVLLGSSMAYVANKIKNKIIQLQA